MFSLMIFQTLLNVGILNVGLKPFFYFIKEDGNRIFGNQPKSHGEHDNIL